jgi:hypothetical protein
MEGIECPQCPREPDFLPKMDPRNAKQIFYFYQNGESDPADAPEQNCKTGNFRLWK